MLSERGALCNQKKGQIQNGLPYWRNRMVFLVWIWELVSHQAPSINVLPLFLLKKAFVLLLVACNLSMKLQATLFWFQEQKHSPFGKRSFSWLFYLTFYWHTQQRCSLFVIFPGVAVAKRESIAKNSWTFSLLLFYSTDSCIVLLDAPPKSHLSGGYHWWLRGSIAEKLI